MTTAAMMLVDDGTVQLDAPVANYLPAFANVKLRSNGQWITPKRPMTVADLMRHTPGISPMENVRDVRVRDASDLDDFVEQLSKIPLRNHSSEQWHYSKSIDVLRAIVEKVSGKSLDVFLHERLLHPLGMKDTVHWVIPAKRDRLASCYWRNADGLKLFKMEDEARFFKRPTVLSGSSGLFSTAEDYARFLMMIAAGGHWGGRQYLKPESVKSTTSNQLPPPAQLSGFGFGFGFYVNTGKIQSNTEERGRRILMGRCRIDALLGQSQRRSTSRCDDGTDSPKEQGYGNLAQASHLHRHREMTAARRGGSDHLANRQQTRARICLPTGPSPG